MLLVIDNYDSFTYNLVQYIEELAAGEIRVLRNDALPVAEVLALKPAKIVISPGPCTPNEAGVSLELIKAVAGKLPLLGVCLGHQAIGQVFGGKVVRARVPVHGKTSSITHTGRGVFRELPNPFIATRYHSLIVERATLPSELEILATSESGEIMALHHRSFPTLIGVQFHPESILTTVGKDLLRAFLALS